MAKASRRPKKAEATGSEIHGDVKLAPINRKLVTLRVKGISPLIQHKWDEKAKQMMRDKHAGKKTKAREARDPEAEGQAATYYTPDGKYGILATALKASMIGAAHKDLGIEKTLVKKALFIYPGGENPVIPMDCDKPVIQEDMVRVGAGAADLRYRPYFFRWAVTVTLEVDFDLLQLRDLVTLINRAGFGIGLHEWRPENGGEYGRFVVDEKFKIKVEDAPQAMAA